MKGFFQLPAVQNSNNVVCLRLFYDQVETSVRTLGAEINTYGSLLIPLWTEKLSDDLCLRIARKLDNDQWPYLWSILRFTRQLHYLLSAVQNIKELVIFVTKRIMYHISVWKCQIPKHVFLYCAEKSFAYMF